MSFQDNLSAIFDRIANGKETEGDIQALRELFRKYNCLDAVQLGKYNVNIGQGQDIHIGDRTYVTWNDEAIQALIEVVQKQHPKPVGIPANLPYSGVVEFVGRDEVMSQLHQMLQQSYRVAVSAIAGMGGVGKTELALQYALKYQRTYPAGICWLSARGVDVGTQIVQFGRSLLDLNLPEDVKLLEQVRFCWRHWQSGEVLLVFDDVTDYAAIKPYLPPSTASHFKVLITTRLRLGASVKQLELEVLDESAALELLESLVGGDRVQMERDCAQQLCAQLGYLPLGLELVGRYLVRKPDLLLATMLQRLQQKRLATRALCQTDADMTAQLGVAAAFELSWEILSESAQSLGYLLSLFAAAPIPWSLVEQCLANQDPESLEETRDSELRDLYLLQRTKPGIYSLHPLIHNFFQEKLNQIQEADNFKNALVSAMVILSREIPEPSKFTQADNIKFEPYSAHLLEVAHHLYAYVADEEIVNYFEAIAGFYYAQGVYIQAEFICKRCLELTQTRFNERHIAVADSYNNLAELYRTHGYLEKAEPLYIKAIEITDKLVEYPDKLARSLNNIALLYGQQNRYSEAENSHKKALDIKINLYGEENRDIANTFNNLAELYRIQGRIPEAQTLCLRALTIRKDLLGENHLLVGNSFNNLALIYQEQYLNEKAEDLLIKAINIAKNHLGDNHYIVANRLTNLANVHCRQGRYSAAQDEYEQAVIICDSRLPPEHPTTIKCRKNLADFLKQEK
jgi:tetratricopeptide (TPR) repeat protein